MEGCAKCIKYLVFFFNLIFWLAGCAILGVGIWVRVEQGDYVTLFPDIDVLSAANICIAAGCIVMVVGFLGCCGAIKESQILLIFFFILLLLIFILEIAAGILGFVKMGELIDFVETNLIEGMQNYETEEGLKSAWDRLQSDQQCCGVVNATDWLNVELEGGQELPDSCCLEHEEGCGMDAYSNEEFYTTGCEDRLFELLGEYMTVIGGVAIAIALIQILGMIFSMVLVCSIRAEGKTA